MGTTQSVSGLSEYTFESPATTSSPTAGGSATSLEEEGDCGHSLPSGPVWPGPQDFRNFSSHLQLPESNKNPSALLNRKLFYFAALDYWKLVPTGKMLRATGLCFFPNNIAITYYDDEDSPVFLKTVNESYSQGFDKAELSVFVDTIRLDVNTYCCIENRESELRWDLEVLGPDEKIVSGSWYWMWKTSNDDDCDDDDDGSCMEENDENEESVLAVNMK